MGCTVYTNVENYVEAQAVSDKNIVTANGVGHLEFTREMLLLLGADNPEQIDKWYDFYKNGCVFHEVITFFRFYRLYSWFFRLNYLFLPQIKSYLTVLRNIVVLNTFQFLIRCPFSCEFFPIY